MKLRDAQVGQIVLIGRNRVKVVAFTTSGTGAFVQYLRKGSRTGLKSISVDCEVTTVKG